MTKVTLLSAGPADTRRIGFVLGSLLPAGSVVVLSGRLGAGKTIFVKGIAAGLNISSNITSPSYTIASLYEGDLPFTHVDLYRTGTDEELELLGFDELPDRGGVTAIEWGEKAEGFLDANTIKVTIAIGDADERTIVISNMQDELKRRLEAEDLGGAS